MFNLDEKTYHCRCSVVNVETCFLTIRRTMVLSVLVISSTDPRFDFPSKQP